MYKVSIIDDDVEAMSRLESLLTSYGEKNGVEFSVSKYENPDEYLQVKDIDSDLLFLDIKMPQMDGLSLARRIREWRPNVIIIFCTGFQRFAINGYEVGAFAFLIKPIIESQLVIYLDKVMKKLQDKGKEKITRVKTIGGYRVLRVEDISFVEVSQHSLFYHVRVEREDGALGEEVVQTRASLREVEAELEPYGFYRCNVSYLVNLNQITALKGDSVYLFDKNVLAISRGYKKSFTEKFMDYISKKGNEL